MIDPFTMIAEIKHTRKGIAMNNQLPNFRGLMFSMALTVLLIPCAAKAEVPQLIPYQGVLQENGVLVAVPKSIEFKIYGQYSGGVSLWSETHANVPVTGGKFAVELGQSSSFTQALFQNSSLYLEVSVEGTVLDGRQRFLTVPFAMNSVLGSAPVGTINAYGGDTAPFGWLMCDGTSTMATRTRICTQSSASDLVMAEMAPGQCFTYLIFEGNFCVEMILLSQ